MNAALEGPDFGRYEAAMGVTFATLAFLSKGNPQLVYPDCLWLFLLLFAASLTASVSVRRDPGGLLLPTGALLTAFVSIAAIQSKSGGAGSDLWVLYLLPIFSGAILLRGREAAWIVAGSMLANAAVIASDASVFGAAESFALALKSGVLLGAGVATWTLSKSEREGRRRAAQQRAQIRQLEAVAVVAAGGAGAVHDLGGPLTVILGYAAMRRNDPGVPQGVRDDLAHIERSARYCQELVKSLLSKRDRAMIRRSASELVESALILCEDPLRARGVRISREFAPDETLIRAAGHELERVLVNLVGNAAKAMPAGGRINVSVVTEQAHVRIRVDDDGPGIPSELLPRLFTPFATGNPKSGGVGLGLYSCREIVRRHGGNLTAGSSPQGGARFELIVPSAAVSAQSGAKVQVAAV